MNECAWLVVARFVWFARFGVATRAHAPTCTVPSNEPERQLRRAHPSPLYPSDPLCMGGRMKARMHMLYMRCQLLAFLDNGINGSDFCLTEATTRYYIVRSTSVCLKYNNNNNNQVFYS
jgi:hypothetical protein